MRVKDGFLHIRVEAKLIERLRKAALRIDRPSSQIVREAVKAELDRIEGKGK